jgi:hypothetical protein
MDDRTIVDTEKASASWDEDREWDGSNMISVATGSQWEHERLYCSARGRYYIEHTSQRDGVRSSACYIEPEAAAEWLIANGHELPDDLKQYEAAILE